MEHWLKIVLLTKPKYEIQKSHKQTQNNYYISVRAWQVL